jgi:hypothetical protein
MGQRNEMFQMSVDGKGGGNGYYLFHFTFVLKRRSLLCPVGRYYSHREEVYAEEVPNGILGNPALTEITREREELVS